ncbi:hypothetical protein DH2020_041583 [Rehmannia glutinosa]|uniref:Phytocyanin domain-containing protein n=1 Tax=Rehmannia glutinosa TaxID=99300 RepID=A0ABR0UQX1_REHGL
MGWDIPSNTSVSYSNWVSGKTFMVGDILGTFVTNQHDVLRVPQASYNACTQDNAIGSIITTGDHHYICTFGRHCQFGQRLAITVSSSTPGGVANPPMTAPPTTPTTPATPSPVSTQPEACPAAARVPLAGPPPPDSASTSLAGNYLLILLSAAIAVIF